MTLPTRLPIWLTLVLCAAILACTLTYPFNNDNALYAYMADLALHGRLPYIGSWDQNFPGIVPIQAAQILLFGRSQIAFHVVDILLQLTGSYALIRIGTKLLNTTAGMLAAVLAALYYIQQGLWMAGERDTYVTLLLLYAILLALNDRHSLLIGLMLGFAILLRPTYGLFVPTFACWYLSQSRSDSRWLRLIAGAAIPILGTVIVYTLASGLTDLWQALILFNFKVYSGTGAAFLLWEPVRFYWLSIVPAVIAICSLWKSSRRVLILILSLFASSVISLLVLYRHSVYHYHPAMTLFLLLSAVGWIWLAEWLARRASMKSVRYLLPAFVLLFFVVQTFRGNTIEHVLLDLARGRIRTLADSYSYYEGSPEFGTAIQDSVGRYLRSHTTPNAKVQMFGPYSYPQYFAELGTASRFQTIHAIAMRGTGDSLQAFQTKWRAEYLRDMQLERPVYFIVCDAPEAFRQYYSGRLGHEILRDDFRELGQFVDLHYYPETKIGAFTLYRLRPNVLP